MSKARKIIRVTLKQAVSIIFTIIVFAPFYLVLVNSFKSKGEAARMNIKLPTEWHFENYLKVIDQGKLVQGFSNSLLYAGLATLIAVLICAMAAFVISRHASRLNKFLYYFMICGLFIPINFVTLSTMLQNLQLNDTRAGVIIVYASSMVPFCIFIIRNFVLSVPVEMDEAAVIDGCGPIRLFFEIIVPMMKPILFTAFILQFMGVWSDFMTPLYLTSTSRMWPMNLAVYNFFGKNMSYWNYVFADIVLTCLPVIIVYLLGQKFIVGGLTSGALKE